MLLVLASNSPRRRELITLLGWDFIIRAAEVDESVKLGETPGEYVVRLARQKSLVCAAHGDMVVAADTTVVDEGSILGKPRDASEAKAMLRHLRGHSHKVYTGIAVLVTTDKDPRTDLCVTEVPMRFYSDAEIATYVASGDPLDKAGAYAIQHAGFNPVAELGGCYASVMGLPLCHLTRLLRQFDAVPPADVPGACQSMLDYSCPIFDSVLRGEMVG
jgi:septum formation protein